MRCSRVTHLKSFLLSAVPGRDKEVLRTSWDFKQNVDMRHSQRNLQTSEQAAMYETTGKDNSVINLLVMAYSPTDAIIAVSETWSPSDSAYVLLEASSADSPQTAQASTPLASPSLHIIASSPRNPTKKSLFQQLYTDFSDIFEDFFSGGFETPRAFTICAITALSVLIAVLLVAVIRRTRMRSQRFANLQPNSQPPQSSSHQASGQRSTPCF